MKTKAERPCVRETALKNGIQTLTDKELLMLMLGSGTKELSISKMASKVLDILYTSDMDKLQQKLMEQNGMGPGKTAAILAALECGRRFFGKKDICVRQPADIIPLIQAYALKPQEHFLCISLNGAHEVIKLKVISVGTINRTIIHPREIFADPIADRASAIVIAHNHPSGNPEPSKQDYETTETVFKASQILGIQLLDHVIFTKTDYFSFRESSDLFKENLTA